MKIQVDDQMIEIFAGARVGDVLRKYSRDEWTLVREQKKVVSDSLGHEVSLDGELNGGEKLFVKVRTPEGPRS